MRVLQIIDSLRPGGAEKMAVSYANALVGKVERSYLCCTRKEGLLKSSIKPQVGYLFLDKKRRLQLGALRRLRTFIQEEKIDIVHAHSTSFFLAGLLKMTGLKFRLVWHIHNGASEELPLLEKRIFSFLSNYVQGIIVVNAALRDWARREMHCENVLEIRNFVPKADPGLNSAIKLQGPEEAFKIIYVANLRREKDHLNLIKAFEGIHAKYPFSLHLIGEDPDNEYSQSVLEYIEHSEARHQIYYYGIQADVMGFLEQADIAVLASKYEGLPVALLEYGMAGLPVVATDLEQYKNLLGVDGLLVPTQDPEALANAFIHYYRNPASREEDALNFQKKILDHYSEEAVISGVIAFYRKL